MLDQLKRRLLHSHINIGLWLFVFWLVQFVLWIGMILFVQFVKPSLGSSVLYVTQISHWALVEAAGTAAISSWALVQAKHNSNQIHENDRRLHELHQHLDPEQKTPLS